MKSYTNYCTVILIFLFLTNCQKEDIEETTYTIDKITGLVQKGPYINGTAITVSELNPKLNPTGKVFSSQIYDNRGSFEVSEVSLNSRYVEIRADGFYFDEIKNEKSVAQLTLFGLADVSNLSTINVNLLTQLEKGRVEYLVGTGLSFEKAKSQAQTEVLAVFSIEPAEMTNSELLDISKQDDRNAILLAISLILQADRSVGDLTELIANIGNDLEVDGILDSETIKVELYNHASSIDTIAVRNNLESRYASLEVEANIPDFEKYLRSYINNEYSATIIYITKDVSCYGQVNGEINITVEGGTSPYTYQWSNGEISEDISGLSGGSYSVTVADALNYKTSIKDIIINEPNSLLISDSEINNIILNEQPGSIDITIVGGMPPYSYVWSNGEYTEDLLNIISEGEYEVIVTDANNCNTSLILNLSIEYPVFTDLRDGTEYKYITLGDQTWMAENLKYLPSVSPPSSGSSAEPFYYVNGYEGTSVTEATTAANFETYGVLYNWPAAMETCPSGWHLPSNEEWQALEYYAHSINSITIAKSLATDYGWEFSPNVAATGNFDYPLYRNVTGFSALPGGYRSDLGFTNNPGRGGYWWSSTEYETDFAWFMLLNHDRNLMRYANNSKVFGFSVRCLKD